MKTLNFSSQRKTEYNTVHGVGSFTMEVDFVPNFIQTEFHEKAQSLNTTDLLTWELTATATGYEIEVFYTSTEKRLVKTTLAKLPVNPEQTISF